jgi:hypothetical protein
MVEERLEAIPILTNKFGSIVDGFWDVLGMKAASLFRLHESEVWQGLYRLAVEVFWALGDATGRSGGVTGKSGGAT